MDKISYVRPSAEEVLIRFESNILYTSPGGGGSEDVEDNTDPVF